MALTSRHVFRDADYRVGVIPVNDSQGVACDLQGLVLYDSNGNAISTFTCDTELPAAALLADGDAIPTTPTVGAVMRGINASGTVDNAKLAKAHDIDSGAGTEYAIGTSLRFSGSGGSTEAFKAIDQAGFVTIANALVPAKYDYISLAYTGSNLTTVVFKTGGAGGTTQATLTLSYTGSQLDSVTKT